MRKILVIGGTVFVSRFVAEYFADLGDEVYVLNRNRHPQPKGTALIEGDRHELGEILKQYKFDAVLDVTAYTGEDVSDLLDALGEFGDYVLISSSAVYPEYLPRKGEMKLQFFHVRDLCRCIDGILRQHPADHIYNVGNEECLSVREWVGLCYDVTGHIPEYREVYEDIDQREYFSFYDYEYKLDVTRQKELIGDTISMEQGLREAYLWYREHRAEIRRKDYMAFIDKMLLL